MEKATLKQRPPGKGKKPATAMRSGRKSNPGREVKLSRSLKVPRSVECLRNGKKATVSAAKIEGGTGNERQVVQGLGPGAEGQSVGKGCHPAGPSKIGLATDHLTS